MSSRSWLYLQNPRDAILLKDFIRIAKDTEDLETQVCGASMKVQAATLFLLFAAFRFFCKHFENQN